MVPFSCIGLLTSRKWKWRHGYVYIRLSRRPNISIFGVCELCDTFNCFIIELCIEEKGVGRILEQIILQMK